MECTIEKLTIQVSESNATKEEQADIHELIVSQFCTIFEKMQRLVVELEAYGDERPSLIKTIDRLNGALKEARDTIDSRGKSLMYSITVYHLHSYVVNCKKVQGDLHMASSFITIFREPFLVRKFHDRC